MTIVQIIVYYNIKIGGITMSSSYDSGYGTEWKDFFVQHRQGYYTSVSDFHKHEFYEINLILSGNIKILFTDKTEQGRENKIVLTRPGTPHYISCKSDTLYSRLYLLFSDEFLSEYVPEWKRLVSVFGKNGRIITISEEQKFFCQNTIEKIKLENDRFRQKILILYLLSYICDFAGNDKATSEEIPQFVMNALTFIEENYKEKIVASELAEKLYVSRTTLMTSFKKYTDSTLNDYIINCRLKNAVRLLKQGKSEYEVAELCGFNDSCSLIRTFKKKFNLTPKQYLKTNDTIY